IKYRKLHEDIIASESPFRQIAIEYEIERLSADYGQRFIGHCVRVLGSEILNGLSFVQEHAAIDIGHTKFNMNQLNRLLTRHPEFAEQLIGAGISALTAYDLFLSDCLAKAKFHLNYPTN